MQSKKNNERPGICKNYPKNAPPKHQKIDYSGDSSVS